MYALMFALCCSCKMIIGFNPNKVPSLIVDGNREPLCKDCAELWNEMHPEIARPIQEGAYEPCDETEIAWN